MGLWGKAKAYFKRAGDNVGDVAKRYGRESAKVKADVQPYAAFAGTAALNFVPVIGPALSLGAGALATSAAPYYGSTAARAQGKKGSEAKEAGRDQRERVGYAAAAGAVTGFIASWLLGGGVFAQAATPTVPVATQGGVIVDAAPESIGIIAGVEQGSTLAAVPSSAAGAGGILGTGVTWTQAIGAILGLGGKLIPGGEPKPPGGGINPYPNGTDGGSYDAGVQVPVSLGGGDGAGPSDPGIGGVGGDFFDTPGGKLALALGAGAALFGGIYLYRKVA